MHKSWFTNLHREFDAEVEAEFTRQFPTWIRIPESRTAKALRILLMEQVGADNWKALIQAKCSNVMSQLAEEHATGSSSSRPRLQWDSILAGDGQLWGRVSVIHYLEYEDLKNRAIRALRDVKDLDGDTIRFCDGLPVLREELESLSRLAPPTWKSIGDSLREALVQRLGYQETSPWEDISFEKTMSAGHQLRLNFGKLSGGFGFDYNSVLIPAKGHGFQLSYERTLGVGVGAWNRISKDNLKDAIDALVSVTARLEAMIMIADDATVL